MRNLLDLTGKVALITGASSGIGYATALMFAEAGAAVAINYNRNQKGAEDARRRIADAGGRAIVIQADVKHNQEIEAMCGRVTEAFGPIDILVNNAGSLIERQKFLDLTEERWNEVFDLNLKSAFLCCKAVVPSMMDRRTGAIINVSSIAARNGGGLGAIHYATAKGGLTTFTKGLAKELAPYGVRVNAVSPGVIDTPYHEQFTTPELMRAFVASIPTGRAGTSEEVAAVITFLAADSASYLIGETIEINGGMLML